MARDETPELKIALSFKIQTTSFWVKKKYSSFIQDNKMGSGTRLMFLRHFCGSQIQLFIFLHGYFVFEREGLIYKYAKRGNFLFFQ